MLNVSFDVDDNSGNLTASWPAVNDAVGYVVIFYNDSFRYKESVQTTDIMLGVEYRGHVYNISVYAYLNVLSFALNTSLDFTGELTCVYMNLPA